MPKKSWENVKKTWFPQVIMAKNGLYLENLGDLSNH